ncbi:Protein N-acetyltransferase, RimJ/RimL family [Chishuiella changwenlii]|uniref:N-acetyltransferase YbbJ n=1 Tax=Chishuiella changwenlii TaxID=1434701 RepID=A0A1M7B7N9_9FLAO|nr:GNAT family N-acetyltransferase [Chishuiella changwenlii]GGE96061.1 putative N-acetyltransferase YbbJ [Chishuiella changwenlii]SHL50944.1 Protein N-acetyltransferase, RimJ/RimL family [Chishuiella changwenlii]
MAKLQLRFYQQKHYNDLVSYSLPEEQLYFTALPLQVFERLEQREDDFAKAVTILLDEKPIGFFVLDFGEDKMDLTNNENSLLLRSLSINPKYQGEGYGKSAMLLMDSFVKENYPIVEELVLAVNFKNKSAYNLYLKVGYIDDGSVREMEKGKQHLLRKKL